jgi:hypothetical protein
MYVRTIKRQNKDGSVVEYVQLAHNSRHPEKGYSRAEVIYSFGRRDQLDIEALKRLVGSLSRFLSPQDAVALQTQTNGQSSLKFIKSRSAGGALVLKALWEKINMHQCLEKILADRDFTAPMDKALFATVAYRRIYQ